VDGVKLNIENLLFAPYVGEGEPVVQKYYVVLETDKFGDPSLWYMDVVAYLDGAGNLLNIGWQTVFRPGYVTISWRPFEPGRGLTHIITEVDQNIYSIEHDPDTPGYGPTSLMFPAFHLAPHRGTLVVGGISYTYSASQR